MEWRKYVFAGANALMSLKTARIRTNQPGDHTVSSEHLRFMYVLVSSLFFFVWFSAAQ